MRCPLPLTPPAQVVKLLWEYIRAHNLQDPANRRRILLDDKLKTLFPGESTDMFKMNKHLSRHCKVDGASHALAGLGPGAGLGYMLRVGQGLRPASGVLLRMAGRCAA